MLFFLTTFSVLSKDFVILPDIFLFEKVFFDHSSWSWLVNNHRSDFIHVDQLHRQKSILFRQEKKTSLIGNPSFVIHTPPLILNHLHFRRSDVTNVVPLTTSIVPSLGCVFRYGRHVVVKKCAQAWSRNPSKLFLLCTLTTLRAWK